MMLNLVWGLAQAANPVHREIGLPCTTLSEDTEKSHEITYGVYPVLESCLSSRITDLRT